MAQIYNLSNGLFEYAEGQGGEDSVGLVGHRVGAVTGITGGYLTSGASVPEIGGTVNLPNLTAVFTGVNGVFG